MKTVPFFVGLLLTVCIGSRPAIEPPQIAITNGIVQASLYLPDTAQGYYRGTRFDWSGAFKNLDHNGHHYIEPWFENYNPKTHDAINGPVEEFVALDFAAVKPGDSFVKIGVGVLQKPDDKPYSFVTNYKVLDYGKWTVKTGKDKVVFRHDLTDATGYGYEYTKTVRLTKGKPELVLEHSLKNTGQKPIETSAYNHNFWVIDKQPTGPQITIRFPFAVSGEGKGFGSTILAQGNNLVYSRDLNKNEQVFSAALKGFGPSASDYDFRIENLKSGAGVHAVGNQPLEKLVFWACATTSCPEPYIRLKAAPNQKITWTTNYEFYQNATP